MTLVTVDKWKAKGVYLARAEQYFRAMNDSFKNGDWDACVGNAIHTVISSQDALCIHLKGQRYKGTDHREAATFFKTLSQSDEHKKAFQRLTRLIKTKTDAEYGDTNLTEKDAQFSIKDAERFLGYIKTMLSV